MKSGLSKMIGLSVGLVLLANGVSGGAKELPTSHPPAQQVSSDGGDFSAAKVGTRPAALHAVDLAGTSLSLSRFHGKVVLLHFWTTRCPMCGVELPNVLRIYRKWHSQGLEVIGLPLDDTLTRGEMRKFVRGHGLPWPVVFDGKGWDSPAINPYHVDSMPFSLLIGRDGKIAAVDPRGAVLDAAVRMALGRGTT